MIALFDLYRRKNPATLAALAGLSLAICFPLWSTLSERGLSLRPEIWGHVWGLVPQNPLFGVGLNEPLRIKVAEAVFLDTHNIVLAVLYRGGMIGVALFLIMYGYSLYRIWSTSSESRLHTLSAILMLYGLLTLQFDGGSLLGRPTEFWVLLWFPLALSLRVGRSDNERPIFDKFHAVKN
jgi:O-antigen ligase